MQTKKSNQDFQILKGMVAKLKDCEQLSLLNFLVGYLWRDKELYKGVSLWLKDKEQKDESIKFDRVYIGVPKDEPTATVG